MSRKWLSSLIAIGFLLYGFSNISVRAAAPLHSTSRIEGMLVLDVSNSMKSSDPNNISHEAMKMFIDMASLNGDKIGAIAYSDAVMREKALVKILTEEDKVDLKEFIDSIGTYTYTDLSTGVKEAVKVLDASNEQDYVPLIVLLADGNDDLDPKKAKTLAEAQGDLKKAVADAKAKGYPIYTIGLNADGSLNKEVLRNVAENTKGTFFEASNADQLPQILSEIFANHLKLKIVPVKQIVGNSDFEAINITVPNENVVEANISFISSQPIELKLFDPSGKERAIPSNQVLLSRSRTYSMIKLVKPAEGEWTLKVKGVPQDQIDISLVFNYDLKLKLGLPSKQSFNAGEIVNVSAFFEDSGSKVTDQEIYQSMNATVYLKDLEKGKTEEFALNGAGAGAGLAASSSLEILRTMKSS
ncbi:vWA domain-containing protein [Neobacillus sp. 19]|uniref:vWA domain-containing protein n=1 Tax=Neobacillus sp. 19 TaxID=3394458 RepID=UPI003BF70C2A